MKKTVLVAIICVLTLSGPSIAQQQTAKVGTKVQQVEIRDSNNKPIKLPYFGEKHILIFYPDPDNYKQNQHFTDYLEENQIQSDKIYAFGVTNMKDAPFYPNAIIRSVIRSKEKKTGAKIYTDPDYLLRDAWGLGDCNNQFVIIFVTSDGEIAFLKKGKMTDEDIKVFFKVINKYK